MTPIQNISTKVATAPSANILIRLQALVCKINAQLSRLSQETQSRSQTMKKEHRLATDKHAELTKAIGWWAPLIAGGSIASSFTGRALTYFNLDVKTYFNLDEKSYEGALSQLPNFVKGFGELKTSRDQAGITEANSIIQLRQTEISNEAQKSGEARDLLSELQQVLANIREIFKKASS